MAEKVAVIGAGAWGTAIAKVLAELGHEVCLWCREPALAEAVRTRRENAAYLPGVLLPEGLGAETDLLAAAEGRDWEDICRRRGVEIMVLSPWFQKRLVTLANASGAWRIVFEDDVSVVLVRNDAAAPQERRR